MNLPFALPLVQAPMAGVATPAMAAAVSNAGGLGSLGIAGATPGATRELIREVRSLTDRPFQVNVFCHRPPVPDPEREAAWIARLAPVFAEYGGEPPPRLAPVYGSFVDDEEKLAVLLEEKPPIVSFHFGLPSAAALAALKAAGIALFATATSRAEARALEAAGVDAIVAQGYEAGGHRGVFDPAAPDDRLGTLALTRLLVTYAKVPVIAAGGIMDGAGIAAALSLGASAAQLGTAFVACPESAADAAYRAALLAPGAHTVMTAAISGRPARCLSNRFTALAAHVPREAIPAFPIAYDAGKALHAAARERGETGFGAQWAGQGAPLARALPAAELMARLVEELERTRRR